MANNYEKVSEAFSKQSLVFDDLNAENKLSQYLRAQFRNEILTQLKPNSKILELNCGTGLDAIFFAEQGHRVLATDNASGMINELTAKITTNNLNELIQTQLCSFHHLDKIKDKKFDYIISNFGGLNCTKDLQAVLKQFSGLLNKGGKITLMIMPIICPWELIMILKGQFKTAFRRFRKDTPAHIEGVYFHCYYYNPSYIQRVLNKDFKQVTLKGICITVPPEFYQNFVERYPKLFKVLSEVDSVIGKFFPFTYCCDHYLITLEKID